MPEKLKMHSPDLVQSNIDRIAEIFPNCVTEAHGADGKVTRKIDFDLLRQELSDEIVEGPLERYHLNWPGKREAMLAANAPIAKTLRPCRAESVDFDTTQNLFIEGDNLEALKLLQETYLGKVKMIFIDPPYNTGEDFIYDDDYAENIDEYLIRSSQYGLDGERMVQNTEANGRFHSDWASMLFARLKIARNLLRDDGVLLMSIDHDELANAMKVTQEVFGQGNLCGLFVWEKKKKPSFLSASMGTVTDYIVAVAKDRFLSPPFSAGKVEDGKKFPFNNAGNSISTLVFQAKSVRFACDDGVIEPQDMSEGNIVTELLDRVEVKDSTNAAMFRLRGEWRYSQAKLDSFVTAGDEILISKIPFRPNYINRTGALKKTANLLSYRVNGVPTNEDATNEMRQIFGCDVMSHPKPSGLLKYFVRSVTMNSDIVVDFFAGSSTTAHAVWLQNLEDGMTRRFVMVQLNEEIKAETAQNGVGTNAIELLRKLGKSPTIAEISKERLRRCSTLVAAENPLLLQSRDLGFRVLKIDSSNMKDVYYFPQDTSQAMLGGLVDNIKPDRSGEDLLFQVLLDCGVDLGLPVRTEKIDHFEVFFVNDSEHASPDLIACFDPDVPESLVKAIAAKTPLRAVFRDQCFATDADKINVEQIFKQMSPNTQLKSL